MLKNFTAKFKQISTNFVNFIKHRYKLILVVLLLIAGAGYYFSQKAQKNQEQLVFEQPQYQNLTKYLDVPGIVDAKEKARLRFAAGGKIVSLGAQEGDLVKKWQTIAVIDQRDLQKRLEKSLNLYMKQRWDWEQQLDDIESRWIDKEEQRTVDKEQWDLENTVLDVEIQDVAISNTVMSAPFTGILVQSPTNVSNVQVLATDYFELVNPDTLIFLAEVDEEDIAKVKNGQKAKLTLDAYDDLAIETYVNYIAFRSSQSSSGTVFLVECPLMEQGPEAISKYRLGMNGDLQIELATKQNALTIPLIATKQRDNKTYVQVKTAESKTQEKEVELGLETDDRVEILSGLSENDQVLIPQN